MSEEQTLHVLQQRLIEEAPADRLALELLAQKRAEAVYAVLKENGLDEARMTIGASAKTQSVMGKVPMEFTLTVFDGAEQKD